MKAFHYLLPADRNSAAVVAVVVLLLALLMLMPTAAHAQTFQVPFIEQFGCQVVRWMKGPLAILIFVIVVIATLVIGMIAKMDWARIITITVIFGILIGLGGILGNNGYIQNLAGLSGCLQ